MSSLSDGIDKLFNERKKFIVVGLTGRTGSGCSTVAKIMEKTFSALSIPRRLSDDEPDHERSKHRIIYEYAKINWSKFKIVRIKDIITSFVIEEDYEFFKKYCEKLLGTSGGELEARLPIDLKKEYMKLHEARLEVKGLIERERDVSLGSEIVYDFYFNHLPSFTDKIQGCLDKLSYGGFTRAYQVFGNNVRTSGCAYKDEFIPEKLFMLAQRTNVPIKVLRRRSLEDGSRVLVGIDSIKNPYEATFFKDRYSSFYLFAITTEERCRVNRLRNDFNLNDVQISRLDKVEFPEKLRGFKKLTALNVQECIQMSDVHLFNPDIRGGSRRDIKTKTVKYVSLIMNPGLVTPSKEERLMQIAFNAKLNSGCISRQVGAVVTDSSFSVKSIGWNDSAQGQVPCSLRSAEDLLLDENLESYSDYEVQDGNFKETISGIYSLHCGSKELSGRNLAFCFKDMQNCLDGEKNQVHTRALHAEENAFLQLIKNGGASIENGYLFTTASPCELCSKKAYQLGIRTVFFIDPYPGIASTHILGVGERRPDLKLFEGAIGRAFHQLFNPIMPQKEVIDLLLSIEVPNKMKQLEKDIKELKSIIIEKQEIIFDLDPDYYGNEIEGTP